MHFRAFAFRQRVYRYTTAPSGKNDDMSHFKMEEVSHISLSPGGAAWSRTKISLFREEVTHPVTTQKCIQIRENTGLSA